MRIVNAFRLRSGGRRALLGDVFDTNRPYVDPATPRSSVEGEVVRPGVCRPESSRVGPFSFDGFIDRDFRPDRCA